MSSGRARSTAAVLAACAVWLAPPAAAWTVDADAPRAELEAFHRALAAAVYATPGHGAKPLGITGWEIAVALGATPDFETAPGVAASIDGNLTGDALGVARASVRKGLPGRFDVGLVYSRLLEGDLDLLTGELQWALLDGGALSPAFGVRLTWTESSGDAGYALQQLGVEALASKGFTAVAVYGGAGLVRSEGRFTPAAAPGFRLDETHEVVYAGVRLNLLLPKITVELRSAEQVSGTVWLAFGF